MLDRLLLYTHTILKMKPGQIAARIRKTVGFHNSLGVLPQPYTGHLFFFRTAEELDFDPVFLSRFDADAFAEGKVTFLHETEDFDWNGEWKVPGRSALWHFNLHYFEYLMAYVRAYMDTNDDRYLAAIEECIDGWIRNNPSSSGGNGWVPYTIAVRLVYWFSCIFQLSAFLKEKFRERMILSIHEQFVFLAGHLEKDLLANHYFEDLKALILCSIAFEDSRMLEKSLAAFREQCREQILPDGMHYELSPMYHKIILEDVLRVSAALRSARKTDPGIEGFLQPMINAAYSFEDGLDRIPLFNDGGNNVAKSLGALLRFSEKEFQLKPRAVSQLPESGYYFFCRENWKLIVDAGIPGPRNNDGHSHCDAMSYELFHNGKPMAVNSGTYAYQCRERAYYRSTAAHNTVMADGVEQNQCWGAFRTGKTGKAKALSVTEYSISMEMTDQRGNMIRRRIILDADGITVKDESAGKRLLSYVHITEGTDVRCVTGNAAFYTQPYSKDYGKKETVTVCEISTDSKLEYRVTAGTGSYIDSPVPERSSWPGYKPLAFLDRKLLLYRKGQLYTERNGSIRNVLNVRAQSRKDINRILIRLFRTEPKYAVPIDGHRIIMAADRRLLLADIGLREVTEIFSARDGFSDPLNVCPSSGRWLAVWGEYGPNPAREPVRIHGLKKDLSTEMIHCFPAGMIRHIHNIIPRRSGGYYIFTGDLEDGAGIYEADESFDEIRPLGTGEQQYRAVAGFDTPEGLLYATDAVNERNYVYLLRGEKLREIGPLNGSVIYGTAYHGNYYFATTVEPDENRHGILSWIGRRRGAGILSDEVMLMKVDSELNLSEMIRFKKDAWPMKLMQYGSIQFPRGEGNALWIYPVAVRQYDGQAIRL